MAKIGRPKVDDAKNKVITLRVKASEYDALRKYAKTHNLTITEILKRGIKDIVESH